MQKLSAFITFILLYHNLYADWKAIYYKDSISNVLYNLQLDKSYSPLINDYYFFNNRFLGDNVTYNTSKGYQLLNISKTNSFQDNKKTYTWHKVLVKPLETDKNSFFYIHSFVSNIKAYKIFLHTINNNWYEYKIDVKKSGYQAPQKISINDFISIINSSTKYSSSENIQINEILISVDTILAKKPHLIINNILIYNVEWIEKNCIHPFFSDVFNNSKKDYYSKSKSSLFPFIGGDKNIIPEELYRFHITSPIYLKSDNSNDSEPELLKRIVLQTIKDYPFYKERNLAKESIINKYESLVKIYCKTGIDTLSNILSSFLNKEFNDGHLIIHPPKSNDLKKSKISPISIFEINNRFQIASIFDTTYKKILSIGDEVVSLNNKSIKLIIDSIAKGQYGTPERKKRISESIVLLREKNDSCILSIVDSMKRTKDVIIKYNGKLVIPENFRKSENCDFKILENELSYLRIPNMSNNAYQVLLNYFNEINKSKGLIIDLRGNPGGEMVVGINFFSHFIEKPQAYCHFELFRNNGFDSYIVTPHKLQFSKNLKIIIIGDERTACASESFIMAMKKLNNVSFISSSKTAGTMAAMYNIIFPSGTVFSLNCLAPKYYYNSETQIENNGIEPDVWVHRNSISDLMPYHDKVLCIAKQLINGYR